MDAATFFGNGVLATRLNDFIEEQLDDAAAIATLTDGDLSNVNGTPLSESELEAFHLRALLYSVRPQLIEKGDLFEDTWGTLTALKTQATSNWESVKTRLRNNLTLSLGDINGLRLRLNPASELVAYPPVDIKLGDGDEGGHAAKAPKHRRKKDRNAPKRPRNAYLVFLDRHRPAKQTANPTAAMKDLTREMAKEWQTVSAEERKICDDIAAQNKAAYEEAMKLYQTTLQIGGAVADGEEADVDM